MGNDDHPAGFGGFGEGFDRMPTNARRWGATLLILLLLTNFLNYVDRQAIYILGERIKQDLRLGDAELGFLMGTSFAVFYGVSGIAMGRISDMVSRTQLLALGLAVWSGLTALSGAATNFATLAFARVGVGIGESTGMTCSQSLIADGFPARRRASAMSVYLIGSHLGGAASLLMGAVVLQHWPTWCHSIGGVACGIADWRAAFLAVGAPGLVLAIFIYRFREPPRRHLISDGSLSTRVFREVAAAVPPLTIWSIHRSGGGKAVLRNLALATVLGVSALGAIRLTGDRAQWCAVALGAYSILSWAQGIKLRDRALFDRTFGGRVFAPVMFAGALASCVGASVGAWSAPYALRTFQAEPVTVGLFLGLSAALAATICVPLGGWITDRWRIRDVRAPVWVGLIGMLLSLPFFAFMLMAQDIGTYAGALFFYTFFSMAWMSASAALAQDLVLPRMRGAAAACFSLVMVIISAGFGPYLVGKFSEATGSLATGLVAILAAVPFACALFLIAAIRLPEEIRLVRKLAADEAAMAS